MRKKNITIEDSRLVTVGTMRAIFKEERAVTNRGLKIALEQECIISRTKMHKSFFAMEQRVEEKFVTNERFERHMTNIAGEFNRVHEAIHQLQQSFANMEKMFQVIMREFAGMREDNRRFAQQREQLYRSDIVHERKIDELDERVLKLELAG